MKINLEPGWDRELNEEMAQPYFVKLKEFLTKEKEEGKEIYPPEPLIFNAFSHTPFDKVKVVIIGQDPYHGPGQAHGLSFSVPDQIPLPPSLKNIFIELEQDIGICPPKTGSLYSWADQGVLLLNAVLTVRSKEPGSHSGRGWERFTDAVVGHLMQRKDPVIFVLWGNLAQKKLEPLLQNKQGSYEILTAAHPSPFSAYRGFFGCRHFSKINAILKRWGKEPIDWGKR